MDLSAAASSRIPFIPGTKPSVKNSQLLISSGIPSVDYLIGGGIPIGSLFVIEGDRYGSFAKIMLKYFMSEGINTDQPLLVASKDLKPIQLLSGLPASTISGTVYNQRKNADQMQIAWRYNNMKVLESSPSGRELSGSSYGFKKTMENEVVENADITEWYDDSCPTKDAVFENSAYTHLLCCIRHTLQMGHYSVSETPAKRQVLRITIHCLGSRLWYCDSEENSHKDLLKFLYYFRALLRYSYAVGLISIPAECFQNSDAVIQRIEHLSDIAIRLESLIDSGEEMNPLLKRYYGMFHIKKLPCLNTIAPHKTDPRDLVFRMHHKKFEVEMLRLPPLLDATAQREQDESTLDVDESASQSRNLLDF